ncbi:MAG: alcohol dehydrogenase catalytic domain-containing protein [Actinobacteria bacterium]|nr:alcohol dehydrogenase catalytic domain-containing protein [Actinomycetota bacterium]
MKALVFGVEPEQVTGDEQAASGLAGNLAATPMGLREIDAPSLPGDDWMVLRTRLCGICGSDAKQVLMDYEDDGDNAMTALISFPQVLGHEVVATVEYVGADVDGVAPGQRVLLYPSLGCGPRGIDPVCPACAAGDFSICHHFTDGRLAAGIHTGNSSDATGGFAEFLPAHRSMVVPVPDDVDDEVAVLADPFSVALHAVTRNPPPADGTVVVYGAGALGLSTLAVLAALYPSVHIAAVVRWEAQARLAAAMGAEVVDSDDPLTVVGTLAGWSGGRLQHPWGGLPFTHPGAVDVVYDTIGSAETIEVAIRVLAGRGTLAQMGVSSPARFEWTPWYFKELRLVGSNAFGVEEVEGVRRHAFDHYLALVRDGRVDLRPMLTHTFPLDGWRQAFGALADQGRSGAVKVAFDLR